MSVIILIIPFSDIGWNTDKLVVYIGNLYFLQKKTNFQNVLLAIFVRILFDSQDREMETQRQKGAEEK